MTRRALFTRPYVKATTSYPRPMVQLCRKADGRRWPSEEFPASMQMGQVFRNKVGTSQ